MKNKIETHITEYRKQIEEHRNAIIALNGAIQAVERLQEETSKDAEGEKIGHEQDSDTD